MAAGRHRAMRLVYWLTYEQASSRADVTPLQTDPLGHAKQSPGGTFLHPEVLSSGVDLGVRFNSPEIEDPVRPPPMRKRLTEMLNQEEEDGTGGKGVEMPTPGTTLREELPEYNSSCDSASHVP
ncbi:hypothetical protein NDU88_005329 [Pleurodeles waltl]|uniref:Uncharacterized protein n=1 Tax=Pleurodeles waltl TaxID=8319 RepID=A0AAV7TV48_PLEWA|nr:hypothetical protein NDU88_005329 [Pleurodeles waltl]